MKKISVFLLLLIFSISYSQTEKVEKLVVDSLYREDQFYFNITNNTIRNSPEGFKQNRFSLGLATGFLRDMPINKKRNFSIAAGGSIQVSGTANFDISGNLNFLERT